MTLFVYAFIATFFYVAIRAFQQLNVVHYEWGRVFPTSIVMGLVDVTLILLIVKTNSLWMGLTNGVAGALGCYAGMYVNKYLYERKNHGKV